MARKGENIYKRKDGRWEGRYVKGRKENGAAHYGYIYGYKYKEVKARLFPLKNSYLNQQHIKQSSFAGTVWDWLSFWLEDIAQPTVKPATYASYRHKLSSYILPFIGEKKLGQLTSEDMEFVVSCLLEHGLAPSSIGTVIRICKGAFQKAVDKHFLFVNPCNELTLPKVKKAEIKALSLTSQKKLEQQAFAEQGVSPIILSLYTGMRIGEISALSWKDIDFEKEVITVRHTLQRVMTHDEVGSKTSIVIGVPKSETSIRSIPIPAHLLAYLKKHKNTSTSQYVISCKGKYAEPRVIGYRFAETIKKAKLEHISFHSLRHTFATRCLERGVDVTTLSCLLGHASAKMTLDIYTDSMLEQRKMAMNLLDNLMKKNAEDCAHPSYMPSDPHQLTLLINRIFSMELSQSI